MNEIELLEQETQALLETIQTYLDDPTKANSKRLRLGLGESKKKVTDYRSILMDLDREGQ